MARIYLRDVALEAGVSVAAASQAVNHTGTLATQTRERILAVADRLGYRRDPVLSELAARRFRQDGASSYKKLALISLVSGNRRLMALPEFPLQTAQALGSRLGLEIEPHTVFSKETELDKYLQVLHHRGVEGILFGSLETGARFDSALWNRFCVLGVGDITPSFPFHKVETDWGHSVRVCFAKLREASCQRIGILLIGGTAPTYQDKVRLGAYLSEVAAADGVASLPPFYEDRSDADRETSFMNWFRRHRPDGLIAWPLGPVLSLRASGVRLPEDCRVAMLLARPGHADYAGLAGMERDLRTTTDLRLRLMFDQLRHSERGRPAHAITHRIQLRWRDGD